MRRMLADGSTNPNLPAPIDRGGAASLRRFQASASLCADQIGRRSLELSCGPARKCPQRIRRIRASIHALTEGSDLKRTEQRYRSETVRWRVFTSDDEGSHVRNRDRHRSHRHRSEQVEVRCLARLNGRHIRRRRRFAAAQLIHGSNRPAVRATTCRRGANSRRRRVDPHIEWKQQRDHDYRENAHVATLLLPPRAGNDPQYQLLRRNFSDSEGFRSRLALGYSARMKSSARPDQSASMNSPGIQMSVPRVARRT